MGAGWDFFEEEAFWDFLTFGMVVVWIFYRLASETKITRLYTGGVAHKLVRTVHINPDPKKIERNSNICCYLLANSY